MFCWCCNGTFSKRNGAWHKWLCPRLNLPHPVMILLTILIMLLYPLIIIVLCLLLAIYASCVSTRQGDGLSILLRFSVINNKEYIMQEWPKLTKCECWALAILLAVFIFIPLSLLLATILASVVIALGIIPFWLLCLQFLGRLMCNCFR